MTLEQFVHDDERMARRYEYDDRMVLAVDFGSAGADASVDLVDDTVIVVANGEQYEIELPEDAADAHTFMKNGVLTIDLEAH
ncbi:Hsp20/alpha crystallin family protein [Halosolutus gelatinilyticus]|uniref:Hsp20/alpha crystallin family protein n=1 Tax=Halosolutus gelatinilyticus TaxID=2931975 RepID=UPI001FF33DAA|nr:Hsp20/alpha crystallin family protein [Halosolutus gelatinilyticus]